LNFFTKKSQILLSDHLTFFSSGKLIQKSGDLRKNFTAPGTVTARLPQQKTIPGDEAGYRFLPFSILSES